MSPTDPRRRGLALSLSLALVLTLALGPVAADTSEASLVGRVFAPDGTTPLEGASLKAAHLATETVYESPATGKDGRFSLEGLPAGEYDLAVATEEGLYPARRTVVVKEGERSVLALGVSLAPARAQEGEEGEEDDEEGATPVPQSATKGSFWDRKVVATFTVIGFAGVLGLAADEILDEDEDPDEIFASASQP